MGAEDVLSSFEDVTRQFCKMANLPGFRPGKAPRAVVEKNYGDRIRDEVKKKLTQDAYEKAMTQEKLRAAVYPDIEEIQFSKELAYQFAATVEVQPEFELPDYKGLKVERESRVIGDEDVDKALNYIERMVKKFRDRLRDFESGTEKKGTPL